jgi:hypothetical protein
MSRMGYDDVKQAAGRRYTGMKVGRSHHWEYPDGVWVERKTTPDKWAIHFTSQKRRKGRGAPAGSGAAVGAEYHWFILAHQRARKLDANTYATDMVGAKHMVAFRQPGWERWSSQFKGHKTQKQRLLAILREALQAVEAAPDGMADNPLLPMPGMEAGALAQRVRRPKGKAERRRKPLAREHAAVHGMKARRPRRPSRRAKPAASIAKHAGAATAVAKRP